MVQMSSTRVQSVEDSATVKNAFQILTTEEKSFTVYVDSPEEKAAWLQDFSKVASAGNI
jgi:hypothetical protein